MIQFMDDSIEYSPVMSPPPTHVDTSRPSLGFPLGTGLLLIMIFSLSGIFSCCYHWDKLRSFRRPFSSAAGDATDAVSDEDEDKAKVSHLGWKENKNECLPVLMPGDKIAKFIAMPCPCEPPRLDKIIVQQQVQKPPKPPRIAVPLY